jgi:hypothetical protein
LPLVLPRVGTPRDRDAFTFGPEVGEVARRLGTPPMPWQQHALDVALEVGGDGRLKYDEVVLSIMRQSGKTTLVRAKSVWRCTLVPHRLGPQLAIYLAQTRGAARKKLERDFIGGLRAAEGSGSFVEVVGTRALPKASTRQWKPSMNNGQEHIKFGAGSFLQIDAPNREAGHGDTVDDATIDEAFAHQSDDVEQALRPAMATRRDAQLWVVSTAGDEKSSYLWRKILAGRRLVESGAESRVCYLEWSLPPDAPIDDEGLWWEHMPALGRTIPVDVLRSELARARSRVDADGEDLFRRGYCNQWVRTPQLEGQERVEVVPQVLWESARVDAAVSKIVGPVAFGVGVSAEGRSAAVAVAGRNVDGLVQVEVAVFDQGVFWLEGRLGEMCVRHSPFVVGAAGGSAASALASELGRGAAGVDLVWLSGGRWAAACESFRRAFVELGEGAGLRVVHTGQDWLWESLRGARRKHRGELWVWDRFGLGDVAVLEAATAAVALVESAPQRRRSVYEDRGLEVV